MKLRTFVFFAISLLVAAAVFAQDVPTPATMQDQEVRPAQIVWASEENIGHTLPDVAMPSTILVQGAKECAQLPKDARKVCLEGVKSEAHRAEVAAKQAANAVKSPSCGWLGCAVAVPYGYGDGYYGGNYAPPPVVQPVASRCTSGYWPVDQYGRRTGPFHCYM